LDDKKDYRSKITGFKPKFKPTKASLINRLNMLERAQVFSIINFLGWYKEI